MLGTIRRARRSIPSLRLFRSPAIGPAPSLPGHFLRPASGRAAHCVGPGGTSPRVRPRPRRSMGFAAAASRPKAPSDPTRRWAALTWPIWPMSPGLALTEGAGKLWTGPRATFGSVRPNLMRVARMDSGAPASRWSVGAMLLGGMPQPPGESGAEEDASPLPSARRQCDGPGRSSAGARRHATDRRRQLSSSVRFSGLSSGAGHGVPTRAELRPLKSRSTRARLSP